MASGGGGQRGRGRRAGAPPPGDVITRGEGGGGTWRGMAGGGEVGVSAVMSSGGDVIER